MEPSSDRGGETQSPGLARVVGYRPGNAGLGRELLEPGGQVGYGVRARVRPRSGNRGSRARRPRLMRADVEDPVRRLGSSACERALDGGAAAAPSTRRAPPPAAWLARRGAATAASMMPSASACCFSARQRAAPARGTACRPVAHAVEVFADHRAVEQRQPVLGDQARHLGQRVVPPAARAATRAGWSAPARSGRRCRRRWRRPSPCGRTGWSGE